VIITLNSIIGGTVAELKFKMESDGFSHWSEFWFAAADISSLIYEYIHQLEIPVYAMTDHLGLGGSWWPGWD